MPRVNRFNFSECHLFLRVLKYNFLWWGCDCWRRRCWQVEPDPAILPGSVHIILQENHRGRLPGEGGHCRQRRPGAADALGHGGPGGVWRHHPRLLQVKTAAREKWKMKPRYDQNDLITQSFPIIEVQIFVCWPSRQQTGGPWSTWPGGRRRWRGSAGPWPWWWSWPRQTWRTPPWSAGDTWTNSCDCHHHASYASNCRRRPGINIIGLRSVCGQSFPADDRSCLSSVDHRDRRGPGNW